MGTGLRRLSSLVRVLRLSTWPFIAVGALLLYRIGEALSGYVASHYDDERAGWLLVSLLAFRFLQPFLLFALASFLVIAVHEAGHVVAGWTVGFRFQAVRVRHLHLERNGRALRLRWIWIRDTPRRIGGFAQLFPSHTRSLRSRPTVLSAGGPIASFMLAVALLALACQLYFEDAAQPLAATHGGVILWLAIAGVLSLLCCVLSLISWTEGDWQSDGATLRILLRGGSQADLYCLAYEIHGVVQQALPVRDWPDELLARLIRLHSSDRSLLVGTWGSLIVHERAAEAAELVVRLFQRVHDLASELRADACDVAAILLAYHGERAAARACLTHAAALDAIDPSFHAEAEWIVDQAVSGSGENAGPSREGETTIRGDGDDAGDPTANVWIEKLVTVLGTLTSPGSPSGSVSTDDTKPVNAPLAAAGPDPDAPEPAVVFDEAPPQGPLPRRGRAALAVTAVALLVTLGLGFATHRRHGTVPGTFDLAAARLGEAAPQTGMAPRAVWWQNKVARQFYDFGAECGEREGSLGGDSYREIPAQEDTVFADMPRSEVATKKTLVGQALLFLAQESRVYLPACCADEARSRYPHIARAYRVYFQLKKARPGQQRLFASAFQQGYLAAWALAMRRYNEAIANAPREEKRRLAAHRRLTRELLARTPDDDLEQTVLDYARNKINDDWEHDVAIVKRLPKPIQLVFAMRQIKGEVDGDGFEPLLNSDSLQYAPLAAEGYRLVGATKRAAVVERAIAVMAAEKAKGRNGDDLPKDSEAVLEALDSQFYRLDDVDHVEPERIARYIRTHLDQFVAD